MSSHSISTAQPNTERQNAVFKMALSASDDSDNTIDLLDTGYRSFRFGNFFPLRLRAFARDIPRPTGARSAPYENLRVLRAFVVNIYSQETQKRKNNHLRNLRASGFLAV